nr:hypothetical protein [Bacillota bacterium]
MPARQPALPAAPCPAPPPARPQTRPAGPAPAAAEPVIPLEGERSRPPAFRSRWTLLCHGRFRQRSAVVLPAGRAAPIPASVAASIAAFAPAAARRPPVWEAAGLICPYRCPAAGPAGCRGFRRRPAMPRTTRSPGVPAATPGPRARRRPAPCPAGGFPTGA